ncbi:hypothetical protein NC652_034776 [Populus alba x Populus x berolinensis]|uniref:Protein MIZU-KUSSEI 1-like n=1 Tax=Populus alba x Populus x berolinensis TaxID=444605 RepID=A0AAD6LLP9_9ROSI|nr:hypothetical protein NC652_034776 [Populus alba x Populus x berolinensis]KAJ6969453.1 hypothetical protein NC653_034091 [Populus alba x Populus x berolinensis]
MARTSQDSSSKWHFHWTKKVGNEDDEVPIFKSSNTNEEGKKENVKSHVPFLDIAIRRGHVHFAFQKDPNSPPAFLIELATPISGLVREMASGLVRIALECDKEKEEEKKAVRLQEEPMWRTCCNALPLCGPKEWKVLKAVEPISMGARVLPGFATKAGADGELMYMRAKFEIIVGSRDSRLST